MDTYAASFMIRDVGSLPVAYRFFLGSSPIVISVGARQASTELAHSALDAFDSVLLMPELAPNIAAANASRAPGNTVMSAPRATCGFQQLVAYLVDHKNTVPRPNCIAAVTENRVNRMLKRTRRWLGLRRDRRALSEYAGGNHPPTLRALMRMLRRAGYAAIDVYAIAPSLFEPSDISILSSSSTGVESASTLRERCARFTKTCLAPAYLITARTVPPVGKSISQQVMENLAVLPASSHASHEWRTTRILTSEKDKTLVFIGQSESGVVVRVPHSTAAERSEARAYSMLCRLARQPAVSGIVPAPLLAAKVAGAQVYVETRVPGRALASVLTRSNRHRLVPAVTAFLRALNPRLDQAAVQPVQAQAICTDIDTYVELILGCIGDSRVRDDARASIQQSLATLACRMGVLHGDLGVNNIFVMHDRVCGVIDWEDAHEAAPPLLDAFNYLDSAQRCCEPQLTIADTIPMLARGDWPIAQERSFLHDWFDYCGADFGHCRAYAVLYWLLHVGPQMAFEHDDRFIQTRVLNVLHQLVQ